MRVLLWTDMEGISRVTDHRECWPAFPEYWSTGRQKFTDEVKAAASGLLEGGASAVYVCNAHGLGWPNILWSELPKGSVEADQSAWAAGFDAAFFVGFHAAVDTADGFISHTMVPGLGVNVDGRPVTEPHIWAWLEEIPVLGVAGDRALETQLDGFLAGTPFLAVKDSTSRIHTTPVEADESDSHAAIRDFATVCMSSTLRPLDLPSPFSFEARLDRALAPLADGQAGLELTSEGVLSKECEVWSRDAYPALQAAMGAALKPFFDAQGDLDVSSAEAFERQPADRLQQFQRFFSDWVETP
jgi:D-amino peptidase